MNTFLWLFLNLFLFSLKTHWFLLFTTYDSPDFLLLLLILYALDQGGRKGALYGIGMGLFLDVVSFGYFGYHLVTRALVGAFIGSNRMNVFADRMPTYMILSALVTLLLGVVRGLFLCVMLHRWMPLSPLRFGHCVPLAGTSLWPLLFGSSTKRSRSASCAAIPIIIICNE